MFFEHKTARIRESLLWEYDLSRFDWQAMRLIVVQRVVERGRMEDFYALLNMYGIEGVRESIKEIPVMSPKDMSFVCSVFDIKKEELKCYLRRQSHPQHWNC